MIFFFIKKQPLISQKHSNTAKDATLPRMKQSMHVKKRCYLLILFFWWSINIFAQTTTFTTTDFLSTALQHPHLKLHQNTENYLRNTNHELPIVEEIEFRTETNDFDISKQEYALRFGFSTAKQRAAQRSFHQSNITYYATEKQLVLEDALAKRYETLVELYYQDRLRTAQEQQKILYQDKLMVLRRSIQSTDFDIDELVETEEDLQDLEQDLLERQIKKEQIKNDVQQYLTSASALQVNENNWLSVADIQQRLGLLASDSVLSRPITERRQAAINQIQQEYQLEKAEAENLIQYTQLKYSGGNSDIYKHFSVGIGMLLPLKKTALLDLNELELERLETMNELELELDEIRQDAKKERARLDLFLQQYQLLQEQMQDNQTAYTLEQYRKIEGVSPLSLLKLKELLLKKEWAILKIEYEIFQAYVKYLRLSGQMMELPLRDFLSKDLILLKHQ